MSKPTTGLRRAGIASFATGALALSACVVGAGAANADADFAFDRIAGDNRYETAAEVYDAYGDNDSVILANGEQGHFPDALVANYLAGVEGSPILLTRSNKMPDATAARLDGGGKTITIVGGEDVVPADQAAALEAEGHTVERVAGPNRYLTAAEVIEEAGDSPSNTAIITTGVDFPDALAAGPVSVHEGSPIAISRANDIRDEEVDALVASGVSEFIVLGGPTIVGDAVVAELEAAGLDLRDRVFGADRAETSAELANYAIENFGLSNEGVNVASGYIAGTGADALAGGPLTGEQVRPMLITKSNRNPGDGVIAYLTEHSCTLTDGIIFGGPGAVDAQSETEMEAAAQTCEGNQTFAVAGQEAATNVASAATSDSGAREYSVTGLDPELTYDVALFEADNVSVDANGVVSFEDTTPNDGVADQGTPNAEIEQVNGAGVVDASRVEAQPNSQGTLTFLVDAEQATSIIPVVFLDAEATATGTNETGDNALDLDANDEPTEDFGIGGQKTWVPAEGADDSLTTADFVESVDKAANSFVAGGATYFYEADDTFFVEGTAVSQNQFEAQLSTGDGFNAQTDYNREGDADGDTAPSTFDLDNLTPTAPDATVTPMSSTSIEVSIPDNNDLDSYVIYRSAETYASDAAAATAFNSGDDFTQVATVEEDAETDNANVFTDTGLTAGEDYTYVVTSVLDGDESDDEDVNRTATPSTIATITNTELIADAVITGAMDTADQFDVTFSENVTFDETDDGTGPQPYADVTVQDGDGDVAIIRVFPTVTDANAAVVPAGYSKAFVAADDFGDSTDDPETVTVEMVTDAIDRNAAGNSQVEYPTTITNIDGLYDREAGGDTVEVNLENSTDLVIDDEGNVA